MSADIKQEFGRLLRSMRDNKRMSRATLALRLGISPKTIQSWEMGRTFIERLELIPVLEAELECSLSQLIAKATGATPAGSPAPALEVTNQNLLPDLVPGTVVQQKSAVRAGPLAPKFEIFGDPQQLNASGLESEWAAVPLVKPAGILRPVPELQAKDIIKYIVIPRAWIPRAGIILACRMGDSAMMPSIPLGAIVILDMRPLPLEKILGGIAAVELIGKGMRIRRIIKGMGTERYFGAGVMEHARAQMPIRPSKGDRVLGQAVAVMAEL